MSRYKGRQSAKAVEQDFPHFVDMVGCRLAASVTGSTLCTTFTLGTASNHSVDMAGTMLMVQLFDGALLRRN